MKDQDQTTNTTTSGEQDNTQQSGKTFTQEQLDAIINDRLQRERGKYADYDALKAAKAELDTLKAGQLSETEKITKRATDAEAKAQAAEAKVKELSTRGEIERQARKLGIVDDDAAYRLLDASKLEYDDAGQPTNAEALLKDLVKAKPYLVQGTGGGNATNPARGQSAALTREDIAKMSPAEINKRWEEVSQVLEGK